MSLVPATVVRRFLAKRASFGVLSDDRFRPPASIAKAVDTGKLDAKVLSFWKHVVEAHGDHFNYAVAVKHWRNKCAKMNYALPEEFIKGLGGEGSQGDFSAKTGEQVEEWVKEKMKSEGLLSDFGPVAQDWLNQINHFERLVADAQALIEKHMTGIAEGNRVKQRQEWLEIAKKDLEEAQAELDKCRKALHECEEQANRHKTHHAPTVAFEDAFQSMMKAALTALSKDDVIKSVQNALAAFEKGLSQDTKTAGVLGDFAAKLWQKVTGLWSQFKGWVSDLLGLNKQFKSLMDKANA